MLTTTIAAARCCLLAGPLLACLAAAASAQEQTLRLSPHSRADALPAQPLNKFSTQRITPFLAEPLVVSPEQLHAAPRLVATTDGRVLMAQGDRVYALGETHSPLRTADVSVQFRLFRDAVPLKDPINGELLGYEAHALGTAVLVRAERPNPDATTRHTAPYLPATLELQRSKEEIHIGDRLLPEPPPGFHSSTPHRPDFALEARVLKLYTSTALRYAAPQQVVAINKGRRDGLETGHVLAVVAQGQHLRAPTGPPQSAIQLPDEDNGAALVFLTFERVAYVLLVDGHVGVQVGDKLVTPP